MRAFAGLALLLTLACVSPHPPREPGPFRSPGLVELAGLAPTIRLDIRDALAGHFLGEAVYRQEQAFLQRPAAARRRRDLLRAAMEAEGFSVYEVEWWHFDYRDWREYAVLDLDFEEIGGS